LTSQAAAEAAAARMWAEDRASRSLGMVIDAIGPGSARLAMTVTPSMVNGHGICHGGLIFSLADSAFAFACNSHGPAAVAASASIQFLRPARLGDALIAEAREQHLAGRTGITDVAVTRAGGELIALFRGTSRVVGQNPG
jgi:acyl-CoA thioesterase